MRATAGAYTDCKDGAAGGIVCPGTILKEASSRRRGFTLIEVAASFAMMLILAGTIVTLLSQHVFFMQVFNSSSFLSEEAPRVNALVSSIVNQADSYFVYSDRAAAVTGTSPVLTGGLAVRLTFRNPTGVADESILAFEGGKLNYHYKNGGVWSATPDWCVSSQPQTVTFSNAQGLLLVTLLGPKNEVITFAGTTE